MTHGELLAVLERLEQELSAAQRPTERLALHEALLRVRWFTERWLPLDEAVARLGLSEAIIEGCITRGRFAAVEIGRRRFVAIADVERMEALRRALHDLADMGDPTPEELEDLERVEWQRGAD